jgi:alkaline phosphatase
MTAIVTGSKTKNGMISVAAEPGTPPLKTILEYAEEHGLATGVLSNVTITDATPAACYAHVPSRKLWGDIFLQIFEPRFGDGVDVLFGPGRAAIFKQIAELGKDIDAVSKEKGRPVYLSIDDVPSEAQRALVVAEKDFDLKAAARRAIRMLSKSQKGFFLMIESDAHTNDPEVGLSRLVNFDNLIREIASTVDMEETLLLYTADHSFDLRIAGNGGPDSPILQGIEDWKAAGGKGPVRTSALRVENAHTAEEVPVMAIGPGSERVRGYMPNSNLFNIMIEAFGWKR